MRTDPRISRETLQSGGFQFLWRAKLDNQSRQQISLTQPLLLGNIISYKGFKALAFIGGSADNVYAIDYDLHRMFWTRHIATTSSVNETLQCPGGLTAITRATAITTPNPNTAGRGEPPPVSVPERGATPSGAAAVPPAGPSRAGGAPANSNLMNAVYAIASDGTVHILNPQTGEDLTSPVKFLGSGARLAGSILVNNTLYAATADKCGNVPNGVYSVDLGSQARTVNHWETNGGSIVGNLGPTLGNDGTVYVATADGDYSPTTYSNSVVALQPNTLALKDSFSPGRTAFKSAPVVFSYGGRDIVAASNTDGRVYLLDSASLGGADHGTSTAKSDSFTAKGAESLATWEESDGTRWLLAASNGPVSADAHFPSMNGGVVNGAIVAFKVVGQGKNLGLQPSWVSRDIPSVLSPIVVNGVVFALSSGGARTGSAVLYALDGISGKELWNSGTTITSFVSSGGLAAGDGQVYVPTYDNTLYAFGIPLEH